MIVHPNQILLAFSLCDLRCIVLTIRKQIIAYKKGAFAPPTERQEGRLLPPAPLSGVPASSSRHFCSFYYLQKMAFYHRKGHVVNASLRIFILMYPSNLKPENGTQCLRGKQFESNSPQRYSSGIIWAVSNVVTAFE